MKLTRLHRGYAYISEWQLLFCRINLSFRNILSKLCGRCVVDTLGIDHTIKHYPTIRCTLLWSCGRNFLKTKTTVAWRTAPKIGCTSEVQKKIRIFFCTSEVCTIFETSALRYSRSEIQKKIEFFFCISLA